MNAAPPSAPKTAKNLGEANFSSFRSTPTNRAKAMNCNISAYCSVKLPPCKNLMK